MLHNCFINSLVQTPPLIDSTANATQLFYYLASPDPPVDGLQSKSYTIVSLPGQSRPHRLQSPRQQLHNCFITWLVQTPPLTASTARATRFSAIKMIHSQKYSRIVGAGFNKGLFIYPRQIDTLSISKLFVNGNKKDVYEINNSKEKKIYFD